jgi:hypothetical protein
MDEEVTYMNRNARSPGRAGINVGPRMRLPNTAQISRPWRIHELTRDFWLEDVWALPTPVVIRGSACLEACFRWSCRCCY